MIESDKTKFYTVCGTNGDVPFSLEPIFLTIDAAAQAVADEVNKRLKARGLKQRVNVKLCYEGYDLFLDPNVVWHYKVVAHERPYVVRYLDCDEVADSVTVYPTKDEAEAAVAKAAKAAIKALGKDVQYVYADRQGDCEIPKSKVKKSEPYVLVDTYEGNHINWVAQQL